MKSQSKQLAGTLVAALTVAAAIPAQAADDKGVQSWGGSQGLIDVVRDSTHPFLRLSQAEAAGYGLATGCVSGEQGAMGVHYAKSTLLGDGALDATQPEILVYEPTRDGRMRLVGVEYVVFVEAWHATNQAPPVLMGQHFHLLGSPNRYGLPAAYILHVYAWKQNPFGAYANFNPRVTCENYAP